MPRPRIPRVPRALMQIMPATARGDRRQAPGSARSRRQIWPLGQDYLHRLLADPSVNDNLFMMAIAYNAGPGMLAKWRAADMTSDPLLFIESLPKHETRKLRRAGHGECLDLPAALRPGDAQPRPCCRRRLADLSIPGWTCHRQQ